MVNIVLNLLDLVWPFEVSVHSHAYQLKPQFGRCALKTSINQSDDANKADEEEPPPENQENFVIDDVQSKDTNCIDSFLNISEFTIMIMYRPNMGSSSAYRAKIRGILLQQPVKYQKVSPHWMKWKGYLYIFTCHNQTFNSETILLRSWKASPAE